MAKLVNRLGKKYGRLVVVERAPNPYGGTGAAWLCRCKCGNETVALGEDLAKGKFRSCGCYSRDRIAAVGRAHRTHGLTDSRVYRIWTSMLTRCRNPNTGKWKYYGGRGIKVCKRWLKFENFIADMGMPPAGMSLDRINVDADYKPSNCKWSDSREQTRNRRNTVRLTHNGETLSVAEWARRLGIKPSTMHTRISANLPADKLFSTKMK